MSEAKIQELTALSSNFVSRAEHSEALQKMEELNQAVAKLKVTVEALQNAIIEGQSMPKLSTVKRVAKVEDMSVTASIASSASSAISASSASSASISTGSTGSTGNTSSTSSTGNVGSVSSTNISSPKFPQINNYIKHMIANVTEEGPNYVRGYITPELIEATEICRGIETAIYTERQWKALGTTLWDHVKKDVKSPDYLSLREMHRLYMAL